MRRTAPWPDFAGNPIREGDFIGHLSGEVGRVLYQPEHAEPPDRWRVDYGDGGPVSRLGLQIGDKGRAVVGKRDSAGRLVFTHPPPPGCTTMRIGSIGELQDAVNLDMGRIGWTLATTRLTPHRE